MIWMNSVPQAITITVSFAKPFKKADGTYDVPENKKYKRTIAIDKSRKIKYVMPESESLDLKQNPI